MGVVCGCRDTCILSPCLEWIGSSDAQGHATVFVAKYFGRAGLMGFISAVHETQRPALFQSLLLEACGRTVNPVFGAVGLLSDGNWQACQSAMDTVLKGGSIHPPSTATLAFSCLPANLCSSEVPCHAFEKFSTQLPVGGYDDIQGANTPPSRSVTEPIPDHLNNRLGIGSPPFRCLSLKKHADGGPSTAMKSWRKESVRWQNMHHMLSRPNNGNLDSGIKHQLMTQTQEDVNRGSSFEDLHGTSALCPSPRRLRARVKLPSVNSSEPQEKLNKQLITSPRADYLELDLTLTVK